MACSSCNSKRINPRQVDNIFYEVIHQGQPGCTRSKEEVDALVSRLNCVKGKIHYKNFNKFMGFLISMQNFKQYCRYRLEPMIEMLDSYGC